MEEFLIENWKNITYIVGIFSTIVGFIYKNKALRGMVVEFVKDFIKTSSGRKLETHPLFKEEKALDRLIDKISLPHELKTKLFKIIVRRKKEISFEYIKNWIELNKDSYKKISKTELGERLKKLVREIVYGNKKEKKGYEIEIELDFRNLAGEDKGRKYYDIIYEEKFKAEHSQNIKNIVLFLESITLFEESTNLELIEKFLNKVHEALESAALQLPEILRNMNGEFDKI